MATNVAVNTIPGVPQKWLPAEFVAEVDERRAQSRLRGELQQRLDDLKQQLAAATEDAVSLSTDELIEKSRAIRDLEGAIEMFKVDANPHIPAQEVAVDRASSVLLGLGATRWLVDPPVVLRNEEYRQALEEWKKRTQGNPPIPKAQTETDSEIVRTYDSLLRRAGDWSAQVRQWELTARDTRSEAVSILATAGVLLSTGQALLAEGQAFSVPFDTPGRMARDLVGRVR